MVLTNIKRYCSWDQVECSPLCSISWLVDDEDLDNLEENQCNVEVELSVEYTMRGKALLDKINVPIYGAKMATQQEENCKPPKNGP